MHQIGKSEIQLFWDVVALFPLIRRQQTRFTQSHGPKRLDCRVLECSAHLQRYMWVPIWSRAIKILICGLKLTKTNMRICCLIQGTRHATSVYTTPKLNSQVSSACATLKNKFVGFVLVEIVMRHLRKVVFQNLQIWRILTLKRWIPGTKLDECSLKCGQIISGTTAKMLVFNK